MRHADGGGRVKGFDLPYTELGLKEWKAYDPVKNGDYAGSCLPFGMSRNINSPHGSQFVHSNDALAMLWEQNTWFTFVPIAPNPMKWPDDIPEAWNGYSTGHWDGDTLVIETKNFNGYTKLDTTGHPHSKDVVMTNTFLRTDSQHHHAYRDHSRSENVHGGLDECPDVEAESREPTCSWSIPAKRTTAESSTVRSHDGRSQTTSKLRQ